MDPMICEIQARLHLIEHKYHNSNFPTLVLRLLTAFEEDGLLPDIPSTDLPVIAQAAQLHDLGKLFISDEILDSSAPLTVSAESAIQLHPELGKAVLRRVRSYRPALVHEAARNLILDCRCGSFDPRLLAHFADSIDMCASGLYQRSAPHG